jgi:hypothetical protein
MTINYFIRHVALVASLVAIAGLPVSMTYAADQAKPADPSAQPREFGHVAAGAVEDSLQACLARVPKDATAGQRMVAEQGCKLDHATRQAVQASPRF